VSGPRPAIDPAVVREVEARCRRDDGIRITIAAPDDYADIEAVSRGAAAGEVMSPLTAELTAWFVDRNPCGQGFVVIARDVESGQIAGHFVFYPWLLRRRAADGAIDELPVFLHVRLWVDGGFRRRGVFLSMTTFGVELLRRMGIGLVYTVPNPRSAAGFLKLGEEHAGDLPFWVRPLLPGWGWLAGGRPPRGMEVERRPELDERLDGVADRSLPPTVAFWSPRRATLLNWRYPRRPDGDYEIRYVHRAGRPVGYLVTRRMRIKGLRTLVICDFGSEQLDAAVLRAGLEDAARSGERAEIAIAMGGNAAPDLRRALRRTGFIPCPRALLPQPVAVIGGGIGDGDQRLDLPAIDRWHLTPCDWDVF